MKVRPEIAEAIAEGVRAGVFRRAERLNPRTAETWNSLAEPHSQRVGALMERVTGRHSGRAANRPQAR